MAGLIVVIRNIIRAAAVAPIKLKRLHGEGGLHGEPNVGVKRLFPPAGLGSPCKTGRRPQKCQTSGHSPHISQFMQKGIKHLAHLPCEELLQPCMQAENRCLVSQAQI